MGPIGLVVGSTRRNATRSLSLLCPLPTGPVAVPPSAKRPATAPRLQRARHSTGLPRTAQTPLKKCLCSPSSPFFFLPPLFFPLPFFLSTTSFASRPTRASRLNRPITAFLLSSITAFLDSFVASAPLQQFRFAIIFGGFCFSQSLPCTSSWASLRATSSPTSRTGSFPPRSIKPSLRTHLCRLVGNKK
jgi:hypothetical protein